MQVSAVGIYDVQNMVILQQSTLQCRGGQDEELKTSDETSDEMSDMPVRFADSTGSQVNLVELYISYIHVLPLPKIQKVLNSALSLSPNVRRHFGRHGCVVYRKIVSSAFLLSSLPRTSFGRL
jgi:hypothetical protein